MRPSEEELKEIDFFEASLQLEIRQRLILALLCFFGSVTILAVAKLTLGNIAVLLTAAVLVGMVCSIFLD
jgi:hypothetical protein